MSAPETPRRERALLAVETSCDETAIAVVDERGVIRSSVVSSQVDLHARYGGVVPELASRAHLERIVPVLHEALEGAALGHDGRALADTSPELVAIGATYGPGLVGSLLVGLSFAKGLALSLGLPFVGVNHLEGHLYASLLEEPDLAFPAVLCLVSGGHTLLIEMAAPGRYRVLGQSVDDAAGEAFDKVARYLGLAYPGGPAIESAARYGDPSALTLPRPMLAEGLDFSFSGLKTAVVHEVRRHPELSTADVAASFQQAVVEVLVEKTRRAALLSGARSICLAGGVAANTPLREAMASAAGAEGLECHAPSRAMCTDNAAMIAAAGSYLLSHGGASALDLGAVPNLAFPVSAAATFV